MGSEAIRTLTVRFALAFAGLRLVSKDREGDLTQRGDLVGSISTA